MRQTCLIDNHIAVGDALIQLESVDVRFGPGSTVIGAAIVNGLMVEAVKLWPSISSRRQFSKAAMPMVQENIKESWLTHIKIEFLFGMTSRIEKNPGANAPGF